MDKIKIYETALDLIRDGTDWGTGEKESSFLWYVSGIIDMVDKFIKEDDVE